MSYKVTQVLSYDTVKVTPEWRLWKLKKGGEKIRFFNFKVPLNKSVQTDVKVKLFNLLNSKSIEVKGVYSVTPDKVAVCEVHFDGKPISEYFPELIPAPVAEIASPVEQLDAPQQDAEQTT